MAVQILVVTLLLVLMAQTAFSLLEGTDPAIKEACSMESKVTPDELNAVDLNQDLSEPILCYLRCVYEKSKIFDATTGKVDVGAITKSAEFAKIPDGSRPQFLECVQSVGQIATCAQVKELQLCFMKYATM